MIIKQNIIEVCGSGLVIIIDGTEIEYTDLPDLNNGDPITVKGLKLLVLGHDNKMVSPSANLNNPKLVFLIIVCSNVIISIFITSFDS